MRPDDDDGYIEDPVITASHEMNEPVVRTRWRGKWGNVTLPKQRRKNNAASRGYEGDNDWSLRPD